LALELWKCQASPGAVFFRRESLGEGHAAEAQNRWAAPIWCGMSRFTSDLQACKTAPAELIHEWPGSRSPSTRRSEHALSSVHPPPPLGSRRRLANSSRFHPDLVLAGVGAHTFYEHTAAHSARQASAPGAGFWLRFELGIFGRAGRDAARYSCRPGTSWSTASTGRAATFRGQFW